MSCVIYQLQAIFQNERVKQNGIELRHPLYLVVENLNFEGVVDITLKSELLNQVLNVGAVNKVIKLPFQLLTQSG